MPFLQIRIPRVSFLKMVVVGIAKARGSSLSSLVSRAIDCRLDDRVVARMLSTTVGVDLRFEVRFGKWAGVLSLSVAADFRFDDLVEVVTVDDGAGGTHLDTAFPSRRKRINSFSHQCR